MNTSWKTTVFGLMAAIGAGITGAYLVDAKLLAPFPLWLPGFGVLMSSIGTACLGLAARDNNKTSEQVGAGKPPGGAMGLVFLVVAFFILGLGSVALQGCASANKTAYVGVGAADISVQTAMGLWNDYVGKNHPGPEKELQVKAAYEAYQTAMLLVCDAGAAYSAGGGTNAATSLQYAVTRATQTIGDLKTLLVNFGIKIQ